MEHLDETLRRALGSVSTATIHTQLFKRGLSNTVLTGLRAVHPDSGSMVGSAVTLRYIPAREDLDGLEVFQDPRHPQRLAVESVGPGEVLVMDCRGDAQAASGGAILMTRLKQRGAAGMVTDAAVRDAEEIARTGLPVFSAGASPALNLVRHHAVDINVPIACAGVAIYPGDVIVADSDGVIALPRHLADEVARDAQAQDDLEAFLLERVQAGAALPGTYPPDQKTLELYHRSRSDEVGRVE